MSEFFAFLKVVVLAGAGLLIITFVLLALPRSRLRSVGIELMKYAVAAACALLLISPIDILPFLPFDDVGYIVAGIAAIRSAGGDRRRRALELECEKAQRARVAGLDPSEHDARALRLLKGKKHERR